MTPYVRRLHSTGENYRYFSWIIQIRILKKKKTQNTKNTKLVHKLLRELSFLDAPKGLATTTRLAVVLCCTINPLIKASLAI